MPAFLLDHGFVEIAGLGRFELESYSSSVDYPESQVYPPYYDVSFKEGQIEQSYNYIHYLAEKSGLDDALIDETMDKLVTEIRTELSEQHSVTVEGLGELILDEYGIINFESDEYYWGKSAVKEMAIDFVPVPVLRDNPMVISVKNQEVANLDEEGSKSKEEFEADDLEKKSEKIIESDSFHQMEHDVDSEGVEAIDDLEAQWDDSFDEAGNEEESAKDEPTLEEEKIIEVPILQVDAIDEKGESLHEKLQRQEFTKLPPQEEQLAMSDEAEAVSKKALARHRYVLPIMLALLLIAIPLLIYLMRSDELTMADESDPNAIATEILQDEDEDEQIGESTQADIIENEQANELSSVDQLNDQVGYTTDPEIDEEIQVERQEGNSDLKIVDQTPQSTTTANPLKSEYNKSEAFKDGECIIVVGAYSENGNRREMISDLETAGYRVYTDSSRALSRVGVYTTCDPNEIEVNLSFIRKNIESGAWVLKR